MLPETPHHLILVGVQVTSSWPLLPNHEKAVWVGITPLLTSLTTTYVKYRTSRRFFCTGSTIHEYRIKNMIRYQGSTEDHEPCMLCGKYSLQNLVDNIALYLTRRRIEDQLHLILRHFFQVLRPAPFTTRANSQSQVLRRMRRH